MDIPQLSADQYAITWPEPAQAMFEEDSAALEPCEIELKSGAKETGDLLHFTGRDDFFIFRPHKDHAQRAQMIAVRMANVRQLRLTRAVAFTKQATSVPASEMMVYNIEFADGEITSGETAGYVKLPVGLFLYFKSTPGHVLRHFVPSDAIAYSQLGDPLGKALVEENVVSEEQLQVAVEKQSEMRRLVLGDYLIEEGYITAEQLNDALDYQKKKPSLRVGEALIEMGYVTSDALKTALARQRENRGRPLGQILIDMGVTDRDTLDRVHAKQTPLPSVNLSKFSSTSDAIKLIPADTARRLNVVPLAVEDGALIVAVASHPDSKAMSELGLLARMRVVPVLGSAAEIDAKQVEAYGAAPKARVTNASSIGFGASANDVSAALDKLKQGSELSMTEETALKSERLVMSLIEKVASGALNPGILEIKIEADGSNRRTRISFKRP